MDTAKFVDDPEKAIKLGLIRTEEILALLKEKYGDPPEFLTEWAILAVAARMLVEQRTRMLKPHPEFNKKKLKEDLEMGVDWCAAMIEQRVQEEIERIFAA